MNGPGDIEAAQLIAERQLEQADVWPVGANRAEPVGDGRCDRQHLMPALFEGSRQGLSENSLIVTDDKSHLPLPFRQPVITRYPEDVPHSKGYPYHSAGQVSRYSLPRAPAHS